jgi:hypothetical protein
VGCRDSRVAEPPQQPVQPPSPAPTIRVLGSPPQDTQPAASPAPSSGASYAGPPRWWSAGEQTLQVIRGRFDGTSDEECRVSAQEASVLLARLADTFKRQGEAKVLPPWP